MRKYKSLPSFYCSCAGGLGLTVVPLCQPTGQEVKINSIDFKVVTQSCYFPKDSTSSQAAHHGPGRCSHLPFGLGNEEGAGWMCSQRKGEKTGASTESWDLFLVLCEEVYGGMHSSLVSVVSFILLRSPEMVLEGKKKKMQRQD